jgi:tRNA U34 5-methylaminomethyl-2-thiouridine-forming methyltransferase MnmC
MERRIYPTADHSNTVYIRELDETYHSGHGALGESMHVYINNGFCEAMKTQKSLNIFEVGFGTGLNAILTLIAAHQYHIPCTYHSIEAFPLEKSLINQLDYKKLMTDEYHGYFDALQEAAWNDEITISPLFSLKKIHVQLETYTPEIAINLIYFDAFAPDKQPELWTEDIFKRLYSHTCQQGVLVTYSSKGEVRRTLQRTGFMMERLEGPKGKRHMLRGTKG